MTGNSSDDSAAGPAPTTDTDSTRPPTSADRSTPVDDPTSADHSTPADSPPFADHPAVECCERTFTHDGPDHCEHEARGRAIVGVTDADGALLLCVRGDGDHVVLPNGVVGAGEDWAAVARETVEDSLGVAIDLDDPVRVRRVAHVLDDGTHLETTHHVVYRASHPDEGDRDEPDVACDDAWRARWVDGLPGGVEFDEGSVRRDVRLFLDAVEGRGSSPEDDVTADDDVTPGGDDLTADDVTTDDVTADDRPATDRDSSTNA